MLQPELPQCLCHGVPGVGVVRLLRCVLQRGRQQIAARIAYNEIDMVLCFDDPNQKTTDEDVTYISHLCDQNNIPFASNLATAEMLVLGLNQGYLDWRDIVNPKSKPFTA